MASEMEGIIAIDKLKDHYKHCIRLSASNKINPKNAFDLQLIDYMQDLVSTSEDGQMNFKIASSALDVGAKIYSNRVDCIQSEAQKVASSILMALDGQQKGSDNLDDSRADADTSNSSDRLNDSNEDADGQRKVNKKKRPLRKSIKTIAEESALDAKLEKMVLGDVFLDSLSKDYDMSCPAALICYNPLTQPGCLLTIESSNFRKDYRDTSDPLVEISAEQFVTLITKNTNCGQIIRDSLNRHICPRLENFLFNDRSTKISGLDSTLNESLVIPNERPNLNSSKTVGGAHGFDPTMYDDHDANFGDDHFGDADSVSGDCDNHKPDDRRDDILPNLDKIAASNPTDYGYSKEHHRLINTWAGPHAWKVMKAPQTAKKDAPKSARKRVKLEQKPIDFEEEYLTALEKLADKDIRHSSDVIRRWKKPLLPQDHNLNEDSIRTTIIQTFLRPEDTYHCAKSPADALKLIDKDHDYLKNENTQDNPWAAQNGHDSPPGSPGLGGFDDVHDDSDDEFRADPIVDGNELALYGAPINNPLTQQADLEFAGEHLIEQPFTVAQVLIPFAKAAKKMDVRRLKRVMWDLLLPPEKRPDSTMNQTVIEKNLPIDDQEQRNCSGDNDTSQLVEDNQNNTVIMMDDGNTKKTTSPTPSESAVHLEFSNLYGELPVRVSTKMANDLSQPIAFVTLLHLANEKVSIKTMNEFLFKLVHEISNPIFQILPSIYAQNLKLIPKEDLKDFIIEQDEIVQ